jgi:protein-L-isoaspartate(D-aspartate) O-methyltransferase
MSARFRPRRERDRDRDHLLDEIAREAVETAAWTGRAAFSDKVMSALGDVPREDFVMPGDETYAYINRPLPIGHGQTISQPYIVAVMTELLDLKGGERVLEIGTGSGYQAAVLSGLAGEVYSVEVVAELAASAGERLERLGFSNVRVKAGDGRLGWPEHAPYDAIIVTAASEDIPDALVDQLAPGGRMIIPVGTPGGSQVLTVGVKDADGAFSTEPGLPVAFVPLVHGSKAQG